MIMNLVPNAHECGDELMYVVFNDMVTVPINVVSHAPTQGDHNHKCADLC